MANLAEAEPVPNKQPVLTGVLDNQDCSEGVAITRKDTPKIFLAETQTGSHDASGLEMEDEYDPAELLMTDE